MGTEYFFYGDASDPLVSAADLKELSYSTSIGYVDVYVKARDLDVMSESWLIVLNSRNVRVFVD